MKNIFFLMIGAGVCSTTCFGDSPVSTAGSYSLLSSHPGDGGAVHATAAGGTIVADVSMGDTFGGGAAMATDLHAKGNLVGQLYDEKVESAADVEVMADPATVPEGGTRQLVMQVRMDDGTMLRLENGIATWEVVSGPVSGIDGSGVATGGIVYESTAAVVRGTFSGLGDNFGVTVVNVGVDDFGLYAGDGVDDDWQVLYFGESDPEGVGSADKDGDGDTNLTEFLGEFDPTDGSDFLQLKILGKSGSVVELQLNKVIPGRNYRLMDSGDLGLPFEELGILSLPVERVDLRIQHTAAPAERNFYQVRIEKP